MKVHLVVLLIVIGAALFAPAVSAQVVEKKDGYVVSTADIAKEIQLPKISPLVSTTISQGQTHTYSRYVNSGTTSVISDLNWGDTADSLSLTIIAPDATLGPYYDGADGQIDGRILLRVSKSSGVTPGTWWNRIYGYQVTGTQAYTFTSY